MVGSVIRKSHDRAKVDNSKAHFDQTGSDIHEINHRVSNNLQLLSIFLRRQAETLERGSLARDALETAATRLSAIRRFHRFVAGSKPDHPVRFDRLLVDLSREFDAGTGLLCLVDADPVTLSSNSAIHLLIVVNELVLNARKHAYGACEGGTVMIASRCTSDGCLETTVVDNGPGLPKGFGTGRSSGLGMGIVKSMVRQLDGELRVESKEGARITVRIPVR